jgi:hypothetical protein
MLDSENGSVNVQKPKLEINFKNDLRQVLLELFKTSGFLFNHKDSLENLMRQFLNWRMREIPAKPREVHISKELKYKLPEGQIARAFGKIMFNAATGGNLNPHLHKDLRNPGYKDLLLYDWGIHHLHLSVDPDPKHQGFLKGTKELLFARVDSSDFYCIDILDHEPIRSFANQNLVRIMHNNWPHVIAKYRVHEGIGLAQTVTNEDTHTLRTKHANTFVETPDGVIYFPIGGGCVASGMSITVVRGTDWLLNRFEVLEKSIKSNEENLRSRIRDYRGRCPPVLNLKLREWDESGVEAFESRTKTKVMIRWCS